MAAMVPNRGRWIKRRRAGRHRVSIAFVAIPARTALGISPSFLVKKSPGPSAARSSQVFFTKRCRNVQFPLRRFPTKDDFRPAGGMSIRARCSRDHGLLDRLRTLRKEQTHELH
jgi:hypothetical protein